MHLFKLGYPCIHNCEPNIKPFDFSAMIGFDTLANPLCPHDRPPFLSRQREGLLWRERDQSASDWDRSRGFFGPSQVALAGAGT
jgi:hypothetical protein